MEISAPAISLPTGLSGPLVTSVRKRREDRSSISLILSQTSAGNPVIAKGAAILPASKVRHGRERAAMRASLLAKPEKM
jgi:hypothetical protein